MSALVRHVPAAALDKLAKVCGLLGSEHDGERAAAAYRATAIIREAGLTWREVIEAAGPRCVEPVDADPGWYEQLTAVLQDTDCLTGWEREFVLSLCAHGRKWQPSPKQADVLARIWRKVVRG